MSGLECQGQDQDQGQGEEVWGQGVPSRGNSIDKGLGF